MNSVTLDSIGGGALAELFAAELAKVLANIADPNTDERATRSISLTVSFKPRERDAADISLSCNSKLAGTVAFRSQVFMGRQNGKLVMVESDPRQTNLFDQAKPQLASVANFTKDGE